MCKQEYFQKALNLFNLIQDKEATWDDMMELREEFGLPYISKDSLRRTWKIVKELKDNGWELSPEHKVIEECKTDKGEDSSEYYTNDCVKSLLSINKDGTQTSSKVIYLSEEDKNKLKNNDNLLIQHGFNPDEYEIVSVQSSNWQQGRKSGTKTLFSSKITVRPKVKLNDKDLSEIFQELLKEHVKLFSMDCGSVFSYNPDGSSLVFIQPDLHLGRVTTKEETGYDWNLELAIKRAKDNVLQLIERVADKDLSEIVYVIGNDTLNSAMTQHTTSGRHLQENCLPIRSIYKEAANYYIWAIKQLQRLEIPVKVINCFGNHDYYESYTLGLLLEAYFHLDDSVSFDVDGKIRKYHKFKNVLMGFSHGYEDAKRLSGLMQTEVPSLWGEANSRFWICGHLHHLEWEELAGVEIVNCPQLSENDNWTHKNGYSSKKRSMAFIFGKNNLEEVLFLNV